MPAGTKDSDAEALSHAEYWNSRYVNSDGTKPTHEWFKSFDALQPFFEKHLYPHGKDSRILHLGSGDSSIPQDLAKRGYSNQLCIDFSSVVVQLMSAKVDAASSGIQWRQADVRNLSDVPDRSIDVSFDKGTLDAMIYGSPWDPPDEVRKNATAYMNEVFRTLKTEGEFLYITYRQPHFVRPLLNANNLWNMEVEVLRETPSSFDYHAFIMKKPQNEAATPHTTIARA